MIELNVAERIVVAISAVVAALILWKNWGVK